MNATKIHEIPQTCAVVYAATGGNADLDLCDVCPGPCHRGAAVIGTARILAVELESEVCRDRVA